MDLSLINVINIGAIHTSTSEPPVKRARSISLARREEYRKQGRCVCYGVYDYWVYECSLGPYSLTLVGTSGKKYTVMVINEDDGNAINGDSDGSEDYAGSA
jgi:hypothetical protein